jgi:glucokinase
MGKTPANDVQDVIGVDLGGTAIKLGRFDRHGHCLQSMSLPTPQPPEPQAVLDAIVGAIAQLDPHQRCLAIGIGTPGPTDATGRIARIAINLGWKDVPLVDWLEEKTGKPTFLANDANCAGLGEAWLGAGQSFQDLVMLTLGTGVGGAIILDGKLFIGRDGTAGELGLITLDLAGPVCNSGNRGSLEQHVSVQAIRRRTGLEPDELGRRAKAGDEAAIAFWENYGCELGAGLASLVYTLSPEAIIIGGGISASAEFFFPAMRRELESRVLPISRAGLQLLPAQLGGQAGIVGAARLAWQKLDAVGTSSTKPEVSPNMPKVATLERELHQTQLAYQMAADMSLFKAGFLARTSHELRSPLNSIISLHQLILSGLCDSPEEERDFMAQSLGAAQKMLKLLDELIRISKVQTGTTALEIQPLHLAGVLDEVQRLMRLQSQNRSLRLDVDLPADDVYVLADPLWLQQVLLTLLDTSISLTLEGSIRITTQTEPKTKQVLIWLDDNRPEESWHEAIDLLTSSDTTQPATQYLEQLKQTIATSVSQPVPSKLSPSMSLLVSQTLLEMMDGQLTLVTLPEDAIALSTKSPMSQNSFTKRIQCSLPLVTPEIEDNNG